MYKLTDRRLAATEPIFEKYRKGLFQRHSFDAQKFEYELRDLLHTGYQELKDVMIEIVRKRRLDIPRATDRYREVAAHYMENSNAPGVVSEFQQPLADIYGVPNYHYSANIQQKRDEYWKQVFAWGGTGDRMPVDDESEK